MSHGAALIAHIEPSCIFSVQLPLYMQASGRTDAGVHAHQQFVQFFLDDLIDAPEELPPRLNRLLPDDLRVRRLCPVSPQFSVRLHAISREYCYNIAWGQMSDPLKRRYQGFVFGDLNVPAMIVALESMLGTHDFAAFSNSRHDGSITIRTITKARLVMLGDQEARIEVRKLRQCDSRWDTAACSAGVSMRPRPTVMQDTRT